MNLTNFFLGFIIGAMAGVIWLLLAIRDLLRDNHEWNKTHFKDHG